MSDTKFYMSTLEPPCIRSKCLKYPVCRQKALINCDEFKSFYHQCFRMIYTGKMTSSNFHDANYFNIAEIELWSYINSFLPSAIRITSYKTRSRTPNRKLINNGSVYRK
jgi:hypothetical protein